MKNPLQKTEFSILLHLYDDNVVGSDIELNTEELEFMLIGRKDVKILLNK